MGRLATVAETDGSVKTETRANTAPTSWLSQAVALFAKDAKAELRTKTAVSAVGVFTFASLLLLALATETLKEIKAVNRNLLLDTAARTGDVSAALDRASHSAWDSSGKFALLWVLLCFAAFAGLSHSFAHEEEAGTTMALRLTMLPGAVYAGKLAFNLLVLFAVALVLTPAYMLITGMGIGSPFVFISVMVGGCVGLAAAATIVAALAAKAQSTGALYGAIGLPLLLVFLILLMNAANAVYVVNPSALRVVRDVGGLLSYGVLLIAVSTLTFGFVWEE